MLFGSETLTQGSLAKGDIPEFVISLLANDMQLFAEEQRSTVKQAWNSLRL